MTVHVLIPVFNRLTMTHEVLQCLRCQRLDEPLRLVVIDDGSTDGTSGYLAKQDDVTVLKGDGSLWWGGAVDLGLRHILPSAGASDWVLLINNDTEFAVDFVQVLLSAARELAPAAVRSVVTAANAPYEVLSIGTVIDAWRLRVSELLTQKPELRKVHAGVVPVDALSGRGVIYPVAALKAVRGVRSKFTPHYFADYELSVRVRRAGWKLYSVFDAQVRTTDGFGSARQLRGFWGSKFSVCSPSYLPAYLAFWWSASNWPQRITFPFRLFLRWVKGGINKIL